MVGLVGVVITVMVAWTAGTLDRQNDHRLLAVQIRQAAALINSSILSLSEPLATALQVAEATGGDTQQFERLMSDYTGAGGVFVSASLWRSAGTSLLPVASVGAAPAMVPSSSRAQAFVRVALHSSTFVVTSISSGELQRIGYAIANPKSPTYVVYAERAIPANRQVPVESDSAFSDLNYATYLGATTSSDLETTDVPTTRLPLSGGTARVGIPFGDTTITLVASPRGHLGGTLGADLPWALLAGGLLLSVVTAVTAAGLVRRRRDAERDAQTITALYDQLDGVYGEQRSIAEALQRALLPSYNPAIPNLESASRYVAGAAGVDVGGDWYSLIALDDQHFAFAVGDVSGRGIAAASIMARLRFTIRAYLLEGHPPDLVLEMCSHQLDVTSDGHFATVLIGVGDLSTREITLANAGHLNPLIVSDTTSEYVTTKVGLPLGIAPTTYLPSTVVIPPGSALVAFTDGLIERRGEDIDVGLQRLARAASAPDPTLDALLTHLVAQLTANESEDDIAVLAFKWTDSEPSTTPLARAGGDLTVPGEHRSGDGDRTSASPSGVYQA